MCKKILVVTETFYPENFLINDLVAEWVEKGFQIEVLTQWPSYPQGKIYPGYENKTYAIEEWNGVKIHRFKLIEGYRESKIKKILNYWEFVRQGTKIAKEIGAGFDHIFVHHTGPLTLALPAVAIKKAYNIPLTVWSFDIWPSAVYAYGFPNIWPLNCFVEHIVKKVYQNCDNILVSSYRFADIIKKYIPGKHIDYVPNWLIDADNCQSEIRLKKTDFNFTFTGNISVSQNMENVVLGFAKAKLNNATLNIVGDGSSADTLKALIQKENIENVIMHGRYPYNQMHSVLSQSDALVISLVANSGIELTEPLKLQSYLTVGKPIYGIIEGAGKELIESNRLGICAAPNRVDEIAAKFREMVSFTTSNRDKVKNSANQLLETRFNKQLLVKKLTEYIDKTYK